MLPLRTLPIGYWVTNLPATADLVRWAKVRWRIERDCRELKHGLGPGPLLDRRLHHLPPPTPALPSARTSKTPSHLTELYWPPGSEGVRHQLREQCVLVGLEAP